MQLITCMSKKSAPWVALTNLSRVFFTGVAKPVLIFNFFTISVLMSVTHIANAQQADSIIGRWEHRFDSVVIEFMPAEPMSQSTDVAIESPEGESPEGEGPIFYAVTRRDDWHPARINKTLYQNVQYQGSGRWTAQELNDNGKARKVRLRLKRDGFIHTTSYINGRKKVQWAASKK